MARDSRRRTPKRHGHHHSGMRRIGMPPIGGDGADVDGEVVLAAIRALAGDVARMGDDERLHTITASVGALLMLAELAAPQYAELLEFIKAHDPEDAVLEDSPLTARTAGLLTWVHDLTAPEIVSLVAATSSLLDLVARAGFEVPDEIRELFEDEPSPR